MSKLATLEQQVKEMQLEIERLKLDEAEGIKPKILWKPNPQGVYFYMLSNSVDLAKHAGCPGGVTDCRYSRQQLFTTLEEAEFTDRQRIAKMKVLRRVAELNHEQGWVCDWSNYRQIKINPAMWHKDGKLDTWDSFEFQTHPSEYYAAKGVWEKVISEMEADVKLGLWGIE